MLIGEFCRQAGISRDTARHYEKLGLLYPKRRSAGSREYRHYDETSLERIDLIRIGAQSGMNLKEMQPILSDLMAGKVSFDGQRQILIDQIEKIDSRIIELKEARRRLNELFDDIDRREHNA